MTTPTEGDREVLAIIAALHARPGKEQELRRAAESLIEPTRREDGCFVYNLQQGIDDPATFYFYENWASLEALDAHMDSPHFRQFAAGLEDLLDGPLNIQRLRRIA